EIRRQGWCLSRGERDPDVSGVAAAATARCLDRLQADGTRFVPGFGHRFHPLDPRAPRLLPLVAEAAAQGVVSGRVAPIARAVDQECEPPKGRRTPMDSGGATAAISGGLGVPPPLCRGLFVLSRSVGILAMPGRRARPAYATRGRSRANASGSTT